MKQNTSILANQIARIQKNFSLLTKAQQNNIIDNIPLIEDSSNRYNIIQSIFSQANDQQRETLVKIAIDKLINTKYFSSFTHKNFSFLTKEQQNNIISSIYRFQCSVERYNTIQSIFFQANDQQRETLIKIAIDKLINTKYFSSFTHKNFSFLTKEQQNNIINNIPMAEHSLQCNIIQSIFFQANDQQQQDLVRRMINTFLNTQYFSLILQNIISKCDDICKNNLIAALRNDTSKYNHIKNIRIMYEFSNTEQKCQLIDLSILHAFYDAKNSIIADQSKYKVFLAGLAHLPQEVIYDKRVEDIFKKIYSPKITRECILKNFAQIIDKLHDHLQTNQLFQDIMKFTTPSMNQMFFR